MTDRLPLSFATPASSKSWEQSLATAQAAEAAGFWGIGLGERFDGSLAGWTLATALAARTERLHSFHTTLNVPYRYPYILAQEAAALDVISGGRVILCLGTGFEPSRQNYLNAGLPFGTPGERVQDMRDVIAILRGVWRASASATRAASTRSRTWRLPCVRSTVRCRSGSARAVRGCCVSPVSWRTAS